MLMTDSNNIVMSVEKIQTYLHELDTLLTDVPATCRISMLSNPILAFLKHN